MLAVGGVEQYFYEVQSYTTHKNRHYFAFLSSILFFILCDLCNYLFSQFKCQQEGQRRLEVSETVEVLCFYIVIFSFSLVCNGCRPDNTSKKESKMSLRHDPL